MAGIVGGGGGGGGGGVGKESVVTILWDSGRQRFASQDGQAYLEYKLKPPPPAVSSAVALPVNDGKQVMDVLHTFVPASKRGLGLASKLCIAAFTHARDHNMLVLPTCSYVSVCMYVGFDDEEAPLVTILLLQKELEKLQHENFYPMEILNLKPLMHILLMHSLLLPYC